MNKYRTDNLGIEISVVECVNETGKMCTIMQPWGKVNVARKVLKMTEYVQYHDTWDNAYNHLRTRAIAKLDAARSAVNDAHQALMKVEHMTRPKGDKP